MNYEIPVSSRSYWKEAAMLLKSPRHIAFAAMMIALNIAISAFFIPVGANLRIYFSFITNALGGFVYGPVIALCVGFINDIVGFIIHPTGTFFIGYTISSMLGAFIFALLFFRRPISLLHIFLAKHLINIFVNAALGSYWRTFFTPDSAYTLLFTASLVKNLSMLPIETALIYAVLRPLLPAPHRSGMLPKGAPEKIPWFHAL